MASKKRPSGRFFLHISKKCSTFAAVNVKSLIFVCCVAGLCMACTPRAVREARDVVAQADSLWHAGQMYGVDAGDSATLAQAYETLGAIPLPFREGLGVGSSYARSCYHYGRLLRAKEDPISAMQVFIAATHSHTRDYHILGRIYSNMGSICHLAGEFPLSYDMYEKSSQAFLQGGDTLSYYYLLNEMAFELASSKNTDGSLTIIKKIMCNHIEDYTLLAYCSLTRSRAYYEIQNYDSAIYYAHHPYLAGESAATLLLAQSYSHLGNRDSAVYYAEMVLKESPTLEESNNALYILTNEDGNKNLQTILKVAANRSDIQKELEIRQGKLAQATQLLKQDLDREPDLQWLYAIIFTSLTIGICISIYTYRKRNQHKLLSQQVDDLTNANNAAMQLHEQIVHEHTEYTNTLFTQIEQNSTMLYHAEDFPNNINWKDYSAMSKLINDNFGMLVTKLHNRYQLSEKEIRLCVLVLLGNPSGKQLATLLYYGESGIRTLKNRIANKLGTNSVELRTHLINLAISEYSKCSQ